MKVRRLVVASLLSMTLALTGPSFADEVQPSPGPRSESIGVILRGLLGAAAYGIEISVSIL